MSEEIIKRLCWHAGLPRGASSSGLSKPLVDVLEDLQSGAVLDPSGAFQDVMDHLVVLNVAVNGDPPSSTIDVTREWDDQLLYAVSHLIEASVAAAMRMQRQDILRSAWLISFFWDCIVAGDIDDLYEEVKLAEMGDSF